MTRLNYPADVVGLTSERGGRMVRQLSRELRYAVTTKCSAKAWRNVSFLLLAALLVIGQQTRVKAIATFFDVMDSRDCEDLDEFADGFDAYCDERCDPGESQEYEAYWFDIFSACVDYCEHPDEGHGAESGCNNYDSSDINDLDPQCRVECQCLCT
jgi:hypothetical protein